MMDDCTQPRKKGELHRGGKSSHGQSMIPVSSCRTASTRKPALKRQRRSTGDTASSNTSPSTDSLGAQQGHTQQALVSHQAVQQKPSLGSSGGCSAVTESDETLENSQAFTAEVLSKPLTNSNTKSGVRTKSSHQPHKSSKILLSKTTGITQQPQHNYSHKVDTKFGLKLDSPKGHTVRRFTARPKAVMGYRELKRAEEQLSRKCAELQEELDATQARQRHLQDGYDASCQQLRAAQQELSDFKQSSQEAAQAKEEEWRQQREGWENRIRVCEKMLFLCRLNPVSLHVVQPTSDEAQYLHVQQQAAKRRAEKLQEHLVKQSQRSRNVISRSQKLLQALV